MSNNKNEEYEINNKINNDCDKEIKAEIKAEIKEEIKEEILPEIKEEIKAEIKPEIKDNYNEEDFLISSSSDDESEEDEEEENRIAKEERMALQPKFENVDTQKDDLIVVFNRKTRTWKLVLDTQENRDADKEAIIYEYKKNKNKVYYDEKKLEWIWEYDKSIIDEEVFEILNEYIWIDRIDKVDLSNDLLIKTRNAAEFLGMERFAAMCENEMNKKSVIEIKESQYWNNHEWWYDNMVKYTGDILLIPGEQTGKNIESVKIDSSVLFNASQYYEKLLSSDIISNEKILKSLVIKDSNIDQLESLVKYMYCKEYEFKEAESIIIYMISKQLDMYDLPIEAESGIMRNTTTENLEEIKKFAEQVGSNRLMERCKQIKENEKIIEENKKKRQENLLKRKEMIKIREEKKKENEKILQERRKQRAAENRK